MQRRNFFRPYALILDKKQMQYNLACIVLYDKNKNISYVLDTNDCVVSRKRGHSKIASKVICINDNTISTPHCCIIRDSNIHLIEDLNSLNGTYLNGRLLKERKILQFDDIIEIGDTKLIVQKPLNIMETVIRKINDKHISYTQAHRLVNDAFNIDYLTNAIILNKGIVKDIMRFTGLRINLLEAMFTRYELWGIIEKAKQISEPGLVMAEDNINKLLDKLKAT